MTSTRDKTRPGFRIVLWSFRLPLVLFLAFSLALAAVGFVYYSAERNSIKRDAVENLGVIGNVKAEAIADWAEERRNDSGVLASELALTRDIQQWLMDGAPQDDRALRLQRRMESLRTFRDYQNIALADLQGKPLLSAISSVPAFDRPLVDLIRTVGKTGRRQILDLHAATGTPAAAEMHICAPVMADDTGGNRVIAVVVLTIDPAHELFPLISSWPGSSPSAETFLVVKDGDSVLYLSSPRHLKIPPLQLRMPLSDDLPAAMAVRGVEGVVEGIDYRGIPVLAALTSVRETPWRLVAKIDREEVYAPVRRLAVGVSAVVVSLMLATGFLLVAAWRRQQAFLITRRYEAENERLKLAQRFDYLSKYANDIILLADETGRIAEANDRALSAYGYGRTELIGRSLHDLEPPQAPAAHPEQGGDAKPLSPDGSIFESVHRRKDGSFFPVEISARRVAQEGGPWRQLIIRDITERKQAEERTRALEQNLSRTLDALSEGYMILGFDWRYLYVNEAAARHGRLKREDLISRTMPELYPGVERSEVFSKYRLAMEGRVAQRFEAPYTFADGTTGWYEFHVDPVPEGISVLSLEITDRVKASAERSRLAAIVDSSIDAIVSVDLNGIVKSWNAGAERVYGYSALEMIGQPIAMAAPADRQHEAGEIIERIKSGESVVLKDTVRIRKDGRPIDVSAVLSPIRGEDGAVVGLSAIVRDITQKKQDEETLRRTVRALATISRANEALVRAQSETELFHSTCEAIVEAGGYRAAWVGLAENDPDRTVRPVAHAGFDNGYLDSAMISWADNEHGRGPTGTAVRQNAPQINRDFADNPEVAPWREAALKRGYHSSIALPLRDNAHVAGALTIYAADPNAFGPEEVKLLSDLANDLSYGVMALRGRAAQEAASRKLERAMEDTVQAIASTVEMRDPYTAGHERRVTAIAKAIAEAMKLTTDRIHGLGLASMVHDLGKIKVPADILSKPAKLSDL